MGAVGSAWAPAIAAYNPLLWYRQGAASGVVMGDDGSLGLDGTYIGGPTLGEPGAIIGDPDTSILLTQASGQCGVADSHSEAVTGLGAITALAWVKGTNKGVPPDVRGIFSDYDLNGGAGEISWRINTANNDITFSVREETTHTAFPATLSELESILFDGDWHLLGGTWDGAGDGFTRLYIDDALRAISASSLTTMNDASTSKVAVGCLHGSTASAFFWDGWQDEHVLIDSSLSLAEIQALYTAAGY